MAAPDLKYSKEHIWVRMVDPERVKIGITPFAKEKLGDVTSGEWPECQSSVLAHQPIGTLESAKTVTDLYAPVDGRVEQINPSLLEGVEAINADPEGEGWIAILFLADPGQLEELFNDQQYQTWICKEESM